MQLLFSKSEEFGKTNGLNIFKGKVIKFNDKNLKIPHIGWNKIDKKNGIFLTKNLFKNKFYFTHSFYCKPASKEFMIGETNYSNFKFCSIVKKDNIIGMQFHPEKSGSRGLEILNNLRKI